MSYSSISEGGTKTAAFPVEEYITSITEEISMQLSAFIDSNGNEQSNYTEEIEVGKTFTLRRQCYIIFAGGVAYVVPAQYQS